KPDQVSLPAQPIQAEQRAGDFDPAGGGVRGKETVPMVRSYWIVPVVVALAVTGLALSQTSPSGSAAAPAEPRERTLTVQESGEPALKCRLLKSWRQPDGHKAYLVQALCTGEFITIAETADAPEPAGPAGRLDRPGGAGKAVATK